MDQKILLINPPYDIKRYMGGLGKIGWVFPPIGLLYVASYLRKMRPSSDIKVYDFQVDDRDFFSFLKEFDPDVIGITCQSALVTSTLVLAEKIKAFSRRIKIVVGGVHASIRPEDLLACDAVDVVVRCEGEETFLELCVTFSSGKASLSGIKGISYKENGRITTNPDRPLPQDIDIFPMPALDLIPLERYRISPDLKIGSRFGLILTSRGCPHDCLFCANKLLTRRTYRKHSIGRVLEEIDHYIEAYKIDQLIIIDDNFTVDKRRTMELCGEFIKKGYPGKLTWWAEGRVDNLDEELLGKMKQAGCAIFSMGLESGSQRLLDLIGKGITLDQTRKAVGLIHKAGIYSRASLILGLPTETREESERTIKFAYSLPIDQVRFSIATPFPGTKLWEIAVKEGKIDPTNIDWTRLSLMAGYADYDPLYYPQGRTAAEIKALQRRANLFFFLRPRIVMGFLGRVRSFGDLARLVKGLIHFFRSSVK